MPWKQVWQPNPSDSSKEVLQELPKGFIEDSGWEGFKVARLPVKVLLEQKKSGQPIDQRQFYNCRHCKGWIEGDPYQYKESSLGPLCGRRGTTSACIRCGKEIAFSGLVS